MGRRATCLGRADTSCLGRSAVCLGLSTYIAYIPSWPGTSDACLGRSVTCLVRTSCLGRSAASLGLSTCIAYIPSWLGLALPAWEEELTAWEEALPVWDCMAALPAVKILVCKFFPLESKQSHHLYMSAGS